MRAFIFPFVAAMLLLAAAPAIAEDSGAPAASSGSPAAAAEHGSSTVGEAASKNEMSSHDANTAKQGKQADPHKQSE